MIGEWICFGISAAFTLVGVLAFFSAAIGVGRFKFCLNRLHAAAVADTIGVTCVALSAIVYAGLEFVSLKELMVLLIMMLTSPVSTHLLAELEYTVSDSLDDNCRVEDEEKAEAAKEKEE